MNIAVVGSRSFTDYEMLEFTLDYGIAVMRPDSVTIVSGGAIGADQFAEKYAEKRKYDTKIFLPDWKKYGKSAGFKRNKDIIDNCDVLVAFWDGESKGTKHTIDLARAAKKKVKVIDFKFNAEKNPIIELFRNKNRVECIPCSCGKYFPQELMFVCDVRQIMTELYDDEGFLNVETKNVCVYCEKTEKRIIKYHKKPNFPSSDIVEAIEKSKNYFFVEDIWRSYNNTICIYKYFWLRKERFDNNTQNESNKKLYRFDRNYNKFISVEYDYINDENDALDGLYDYFEQF